MAWDPIARTVPQYINPANGLPYSGAVLKFYAEGTTTNISLATDSTGATQVSSVALNASGFPEAGGNVIIPHLDQFFKMALYPSQAAADTDTGADWTVDNIGIGAPTAEWQDSDQTPTFVDTRTFTLSGDQTAAFHARRRLRLIDSGGVDYVTILSSVYTTLTTVTVAVDDGGVLDSGLSTAQLSILAGDNTSVPPHMRTLEDYGASGSGDVTVAVQAAFDAASSEGFVLTDLGGSYLCSAPIVVKSELTYLRGGGTFLKGFVSAESNSDALFINENYAVDPVHDTNIHFYGLGIRNNTTADSGAFISFNWVEGLTLNDMDFVKTADGWTTHLCGKDVSISGGLIDSTGAAIFSDCIHFEYAENVKIEGLIARGQDDAIAFQYQKSDNSSAGPDKASKNIVVSNCVLSSEIANGFRLGAGELATVVPVVANGVYHGVTVSNITIEKIGATGTCVAFSDNRQAYAGKHDNILLSNFVIDDALSAGQLINIRGNEDVTDVANIADRNFGRVIIQDMLFDHDSGGSWISGGGIQDLIIRDCFYMGLDANSGNPIDMQMVNQLTVEDCYIQTNTAGGAAMLLKDFKRLRINRNEFRANSTEFAAVRLDQPNTGAGDSLECLSNQFVGHTRGVSISGTPVALDTCYVLDNVVDGLTTAFSPSITYTTGQVMHRGEAASSDGTTGGTGSAGAGNQYVELVIGGTTYKVLHDGTA